MHERIKNFDFINTRFKRIYCHDCGKYTQSIELKIMKRYNSYVFANLSMCNKCKKLKAMLNL